jgi:hypothetical protein
MRTVTTNDCAVCDSTTPLPVNSAPFTVNPGALSKFRLALSVSVSANVPLRSPLFETISV